MPEKIKAEIEKQAAALDAAKPPLGYHELERIVDRIAAREAARIEQELAR